MLGQMKNEDSTFESSNRVYDRKGLCPTIPTCGGGHLQPKVIKRKERSLAMRGRKFLQPKRTDYGKKIRKAYEAHEVSEKRANIQKLEPRKDGLCNCITTVQNDYLYMANVEGKTEKIEDYLFEDKNGDQYGVFKLTPRECLRLQNVRESDIDKMMAVNSNTQCYKQDGNSICVSVLVAIFSQLHIQGIKTWNERTTDERYSLIESEEEMNDE